MARVTTPPKEEHLDYLKSLICIAFKKSIQTSYDCGILADNVFISTREKISIDTLRRFFGVLKSNSKPSLYTLDVLSKYVGYINWSDLIAKYQVQLQIHHKTLLFDLIINQLSFEELFNRLLSISVNKDLYALFDQVILVKFQKKDIEFFERIMQFKNIFEYNEKFKYEIYNTIHLLGSLCITTDWLKSIAVKNYYNLPYSEDYFVEWLVMTDDIYYFDLIDNYAKVNQKNFSKIAFYHLVYCKHCAFIENWKDFKFHYNKLISLPIIVSNLNNILEMRWYGTVLVYNFHLNSKFDSKAIIEEIIKSNAINNNDAGNRISSLFIISQYLLAVSQYSVIINLFENQAKQISKIIGYWALLNYNQLKVYYAFSLLKTGQIEVAKRIFTEIEPEKFDLNFKRELLQLYNYLKEFTITLAHLQK